MAKFFTYSQNNSGGFFDFDKNKGITAYVIIEAHDGDHADLRFKNIGGYFDGVSKNMDCDCCGDRWTPKADWAERGDDVPSRYGAPVDLSKASTGWLETGQNIVIHYLNGDVRWV